MQSSENQDDLMGEINVTPFVDILLVLLIIFMVTAPAMTRSIGVDLPKEKKSTELSGDILTTQNTLIVGITANKRVLFERKEFGLDHFFRSFKTMVPKKGIEKVYIQADKKVPYEILVKVMVFLKESGYEKVGLVFDQK